MTSKLCVVVPALNEAENLVVVVPRILTELTLLDVKGQVVRHTEVSLVSLGRNMGKATALRRGFEQALSEGAEIIVMMDADGQDDPAELPLLLARLQDGADLVTGARTVRNDRFVKRNTSKLYNAATARLSGAPGKDFNSGFKVMRADVARNASPMLYGELHRYLTVVAHWLGYRVAEVSVQHHERLHGTTKYGLTRFWRGFVDLLTVRFLMTYESRPSHLFSGLGLVSMAAGGLALAYLFVEKLSGAAIGGRPLLIAAVVLALGGLQLVLFGLLAELQVYSRQRDPRW